MNSGRPASFPDRPVKPPEHVRAVETEQSNSTALVDNDYVVKVYRKLEAGINPEIEVGRFLTEVAGFANTPALLGSVELVEGNDQKRDRGRACLCRKSGRRLDRDLGLSRPLCRGTAPAGEQANTRAKAKSRSPICATCRKPEDASPRCISRSPAASEFADFAPEPIQPADVRALDRRCDGPRRARLRRVETTARYRSRKPIARWSIKCWRSARPCTIA